VYLRLKLKFHRHLNRPGPADLVRRIEAAALAARVQRAVQNLGELSELGRAKEVDRLPKFGQFRMLKKSART
jgi:hypothetical protein